MVALRSRSMIKGANSSTKSPLSAYHPQANGFVERRNRTIKDSIVKSLKDRTNRVQCLPAVLFAYRTSRRASTKMTPFKVMYSRQAVLLIELNHVDRSSDFDADISAKVEAMTSIRDKMLSKCSN